MYGHVLTHIWLLIELALGAETSFVEGSSKDKTEDKKVMDIGLMI